MRQQTRCPSLLNRIARVLSSLVVLNDIIGK